MSRVRKQAPPIAYPAQRQRDLTADALSCPTCGRDWGGMAVRVCRTCGDPIRRGERYRVVPIGPGVFCYVHRHCQPGGA